MARHPSRSRSWPLLIAAFACAGIVGATLIVLMRGMFTVGEDTLASTEDSRPLSGRARGDGAPAASKTGYVRAAEHVDLPPPSISAESNAAQDGESIVIAGRIEFPPEVPSDEVAVVVFECFNRERIRLEAPVQDGAPFRFSTPVTSSWAQLSLHARYLYLDDPVRLSLADAPREIVLQPRLGAHVHGRLEGANVADLPERAQEVELRVVDASGEPSRPRFTTFDAEGAFEFRALSCVDAYRLWHTLPDHLPSVDGTFTLRPGESRQIVLVLAPIVVSGRAIDDQGRPIGNARCSFVRSAEPRWPFTQFTAADGTFRIALTADTDATLSVGKAGFRTRALELGAGSRRSELVVALSRVAPLVGRVRWPNGEPAGGICVMAAAESAPFESARGLTDDDGRFEIEEASEGPQTITASGRRTTEALDDDGFPASGPHLVAVREHVERATGELTLTLGPDVAVRGRVLDEHGEPRTNVRVVARPLVPGASAGDEAREVASTFDARDGSYELRGLHSGTWELHAAFAHDRSTPRRIVLDAADAELALEFPRGSCIRGVVVDEQGAPLAGAHVSLWTAGSQRPTHDVRTDELGRFSLERLTPGPVHVGAQYERTRDEMRRSTPVVALEVLDGRTIERLELRLRAMGTIGGEVLDATGRPIRHAHVDWHPAVDTDQGGERRLADGRSVSRRRGVVQANAQGEFTTPRLDVGTYVISCDAPDSLGVTRLVEVRANQSTRVKLRLTPTRAVVLTTDAAWGRVEVLDADGRVVRESEAIRSDRPVELHLPPGEYQAHLRWLQGRVATRTFTVDASSTTALRVEISTRR